MAISIDHTSYVISIPQNYLTALGGTNYELDVEQFRLDLIDWEDSEDGMQMPRTHNHNSEVTLSGVTYSRFVEILFPYTVTFEDTGNPYTVRCVGANHNLADVTNFPGTEVSLVVGNAAGLIVKSVGSGLSSEEHDALLAAEVASGSAATSSAQAVTDIGAVQTTVDSLPTAVDVGDEIYGRTMPELTGAPPATPSLGQALMLVYMAIRNKLTVTQSAKAIYNDAGAKIAQKNLTDDSVTYTESEMV